MGTVAALALGSCSSATAPGTGGGGALWVANIGTNTILGYTPGQLDSSSNAAPAVVLTTPARFPGDGNAGAAFDHNGNLWVAELSAGPSTVVEYTASQLATSGSPAPNVALISNASSCLDLPIAVAFDRRGNLWVANYGSKPGAQGGGTICEFKADQLAVSGSPIPAITLTNNAGSINTPAGLAFDRSGNLWLTNESTIVEFSVGQLASSGSPLPAVTLLYGIGSSKSAKALAFDGDGNLWVGSAFAGVVEFTSSQLQSSGNPTPAVTLTPTGNGADVLIWPVGLVFDDHANLWVASASNNVVGEFAASQLKASGAPTPVVTISNPSIVEPFALAFAR